MNKIVHELVIDNFAGGGGASTGIEIAIGRHVDVAINHDPLAVAMHKVNHPYTKHYCESVWEVDPRKVAAGRPVGLVWLSPDCKHFSKAKGGKPVEKNIRGLAWVAVRWAATVRPRVIILENVEEFKTWGPLLKDGYPDPKQKGRTFNCFVNALRRQGYAVETRELRACDFGAPTIRKRLFLIARRDGRPIVWPEPTHGDPKSDAVRSGKLQPWRTAAEIIDWSIPCPSIFERPRPLADNTMRRIARGIQKFVIDNPDPFIINYKFSNDPESTEKPLSTITSVNGHYIISPTITAIGQTGGGNRTAAADEPLRTVVSKAEQCLIAPTLVQLGYGERTGQLPRVPGLDKPLGTVVSGGGKFGLVAAFISKYYDGGYQSAGAAADQPLHTVTSVDHNALVSSHILKLKGTNIGHQDTEPLQTITAGGLHFGEVRAFLMKYYGTGEGQVIGDPLGTVTTKDRFGLVTIQGEEYMIADIGMRMLEPRELFNAQGFPADYVIDRDADGKPITKASQVARCGNAVPPPFAAALVRANLPEMCAGGQVVFNIESMN
jgi:DNA (cytosine-5)-methyltransferase 1